MSYYEKDEMQKWIKDCFEASKHSYRGAYWETWANIGVGTIDRDTREPIDIANRIVMEKMITDTFPSSEYDFERQINGLTGWHSTLGIRMLTEHGDPTPVAFYCWKHIVLPLSDGYTNILDDFVYSAVEYYDNLNTVEHAVIMAKGEKHLPDNPVKRMPSIWGELNEEYPELSWLYGNREYPVWVFELHKALCDTGQWDRDDWTMVEELAREKGLIG